MKILAFFAILLGLKVTANPQQASEIPVTPVVHRAVHDAAQTRALMRYPESFVLEGAFAVVAGQPKKVRGLEFRDIEICILFRARNSLGNYQRSWALFDSNDRYILPVDVCAGSGSSRVDVTDGVKSQFGNMK